jgi:uncharacterized protein (TIGR03437 family)
MRPLVPTLLIAALPLVAEVRLPTSLRLAGPLNDTVSSLGDEISHYPFGPGFGGGAIHGWIAIDFSAPVGRVAKFRITWKSVGDEPVIAFQTGHYIKARAVGCLPSGVQLSKGELNLDTGAVSNLDVHAVFQNLLIDKTSRNNRFPLNSKASRFTVLFGDYPPIDFPFPLGFSDRPKTYTEGKFTTDSAGNITGFEFRGATFLPLAAVPKVALMATYSFGPKGDTVVPGADGCLPGTAPPDQCLSDDRYPDGLRLADNAYLSPILVMSTQELRDPGTPRPNPAARVNGEAVGAAAAAVGTRLYVAAGLDAAGRLSSTVTALDTARNQWSAQPDLPRRVWQACGAAAGTRFYVIGGRERTDGPAVNTVDVLDTAAGSWSVGPVMPVALAEAACVSAGGRIYVLGGRTTTGAPSARALVYEPASGWQALRDMPAPLAGSAAAASAADIYVVNGSQDGSTTTNRVFVLSLATGAWTETTPTNRAVYAASAAFLSGRLHLAGGRTGPAAVLDAGNVHYLTQAMQVLVGKTWYAGLEPPLTVAGIAGAAVGDTWYLVGGDTSVSPDTSAPTGAVQSYTPFDGWLISDTHPVYTSESVRNAVGLGGGPAALAPGALVSILGYNLSTVTQTAPPVTRSGNYLTTDLPLEVGGVRVTVDDRPAGVTSVSPDRIDFQVPFGIVAGRTPRLVKVQVTRNGAAAPAVSVPLVDSAPGLFVYTHGETRELTHLDGAGAIAWNSDGKLNFASQPARKGASVTLRATGLGDVDPRPEPLQRASRDTVATVVKTPEVLIDGRLAAIESARLLPGEAGVYEIRATVPRDARSGLRVNVQLRSGDILSNRGVLVIE